MAIIVIQSADQKVTKAGDKTYLLVVDKAGKKYYCWDMELWDIIKPNFTFDAEIEEKGNFSNIIAVTPIKDQPPISQQDPGEVTVAPQERGMWWKEVGENFRAGLFKKDDQGDGTLLWRAYIAQMLSSLNIKIERKK